MTVEKYAGDEAAAIQRLRLAQDDSRLLSERHDALITKYPDHFVACHAGTIFVDKDMGGLFQQLRAAGIRPADALVTFLRTGNYCFSDLG